MILHLEKKKKNAKYTTTIMHQNLKKICKYITMTLTFYDCLRRINKTFTLKKYILNTFYDFKLSWALKQNKKNKKKVVK